MKNINNCTPLNNIYFQYKKDAICFCIDENGAAVAGVEIENKRG